MTQPGLIDDATVAALRAQFTTDELVELTLRTMKYNIQKVLVALGTDDPVTAEQLAQVRWNQDGSFVAVEV